MKLSSMAILGLLCINIYASTDVSQCQKMSRMEETGCVNGVLEKLEKDLEGEYTKFITSRNERGDINKQDSDKVKYRFIDYIDGQCNLLGDLGLGTGAELETLYCKIKLIDDRMEFLKKER